MRHALKAGGPAYAGSTHVKALSALKENEGSGSLSGGDRSGLLKAPASPAGSTTPAKGIALRGRTYKSRTRVNDDDNVDSDVAGRLAKILVDRFGAELPTRVQVGDSVMFDNWFDTGEFVFIIFVPMS